jgi:hypothetical protein
MTSLVLHAVRGISGTLQRHELTRERLIQSSLYGHFLCNPFLTELGRDRVIGDRVIENLLYMFMGFCA